MDKEKNTSLTETSPSDENKIILLRIVFTRACLPHGIWRNPETINARR